MWTAVGGILTAVSHSDFRYSNSTYGAVSDPLLVAVLQRSPELPRQLGAVDVRVQLGH